MSWIDMDEDGLPFLLTSVAIMVTDVIKRCRQFRQNGLIIGAPGVGKTRALHHAEQLGRDDPRAYPFAAVITVTGVMGGSTRDLLDEVTDVFGVYPSTRIGETHRKLCRQVNPHTAPILLFDEAQNLGNKAVRDLLAISEQAAVQMVFCGNSAALKLVNTSEAAIRQISRRIPVREEVNHIDDEDADLIACHFGLEGMEAFRLCRRIGQQFHADGIAKVLSFARDRTGTRKATLNLADVKAALQLFPHFAAGISAPSVAVKARRQSSMDRADPAIR